MPMFFPKTLRRALKIRFAIGVVVKAAAKPKEAKVKKTTGSENPLSAPPSPEVTPVNGMSPINKKLVTRIGSELAIRIIKKVARSPMVRIPAIERVSLAGRHNETTKTIAAKIRPIKPLPVKVLPNDFLSIFSMIKSSCQEACRTDRLDLLLRRLLLLRISLRLLQ